jgi:hypothetical protein
VTGAARRVGGALVALVLAAYAPGPAALAAPLAATLPATLPATRPAVVPTPGQPWFGPGLDWERDLPADYAERLGETPSLYAQRVRYPLTEDDRDYLAGFAELTATQGAVPVLTLEPQVALTELRPQDADLLGQELADLHERYDSHFLVRFAPEMNGSWTIWGQQPDRYVAAFRTVADAVHDAAGEHAEMVWSPAYGAGYPFGRSYGAVDAAGRRITQVLDTDGDGTVDDGDDPYAPYFPGDRYVDWVGLSLYHYGDHQDFGNNAAPAPGELEARLDDRFGYGVRRQRRSFYDRFASRTRPMLVETSALYNTANERGRPERTLKRAWWRQVLASTTTHPAIGAISWLELTRPEAEIDDEVADWRATHTPALARALRQDLAASDVRLGPVTEVVRPSDEAAKDALPGDSSPDGAGGLTEALPGWVPVGLAVGALGWLVLRLARRRARP